MDLSERVRQARKALKLDIPKKGDFLGVSRATAYGYEKRPGAPPLAVYLGQLCERGVNPDFLLTGNGPILRAPKEDAKATAFDAIASIVDAVRRDAADDALRRSAARAREQAPLPEPEESSDHLRAGGQE